MNEKAIQVYNTLKPMYPRAKCGLNFQSPWQLLVATILSAQCTDTVVNAVTPLLFKRYNTIADLATADVTEVSQIIRPTGFYNNKAKNIIACAQIIMRDFGGCVPDTMEELLKLKGVARKTANIVLTDAFHIVDGIAVDTHVRRLSLRLGLTVHADPLKAEQDLCSAFPRIHWGEINHLMIAFGRATCAAKRPRCQNCPFAHTFCLVNTL